MHGAAHRQHTGLHKFHAGRVDVIAEVVIATATEGIGTDGGHHAPGGYFHAVKGQGHQQGEHIHIVHVILGVARVAVLIPTIVVVIERARPQGGETHVFVELVAGDNTGHVVIEDIAAGGKAGQSHALNAHAHLQVGLGHHPVDVGVLHFNNAVAVGTKSTALTGFTPHLVADFKEDRTGQGFGSHGVQLQAHALTSFEFVFIFVLFIGLVITSHAVAAGKAAVLAIVEAHDPLAFGLEINGAGAGSSTEHQARRQQKRSDLFHG